MIQHLKINKIDANIKRFQFHIKVRVIKFHSNYKRKLISCIIKTKFYYNQSNYLFVSNKTHHSIPLFN